MPCERCGERCQGDRCAGCEQIAANEARHGVPADHYDDDDEGSTNHSEGGRGWAVEQQGLGGGQHEGQSTLTGGVTQEVDR